ncbi:putative wsc domain protein [Neofusicoccum parvum]|uniref:Wsc domain protein n=1 Tax=Neofusicoccum parvum TaxID=310453 RepID=A0ACB5S0P5_9PEZI|nr:putative wsc domain protein [Neofusicoccum parvum]
MMLLNIILALLGVLPMLVQGMWKMPCPGTVLRERIDPVIARGSVSGHVHRVVGSSGINFTMDDPSLALHSGCSSCTVIQDKSSYWVPQLYFANVAFEEIPDATTYELVPDGPVHIVYTQNHALKENGEWETIHAFPPGLTMTAGNPGRANMNFTGDAMSEAITFSCPDQPGLEETHELPANCSSVLASVHFPSCWNGIDLTSEDFFSHMSYPEDGYNRGKCPTTHPVRVILIKYEVTFDTSSFVSTGKSDQPSFTFSEGDTTGYGFHGVFINGWDTDILQHAIETCTDGITGDIATTCPVLAQYTTEQCLDCRVPPRVDEPIDKVVTLPGCNPVQWIPPTGRVNTAQDCATNSSDEIGDFKTYFEDLTGRGWAYGGCPHFSEPLGCNSDGSQTAPYSHPDMTPAKCAEYCESELAGKSGFAWASVQGPVCTCSDKGPLNYTAPLPEYLGRCDHSCPGDNSLTCGGNHSTSLYRACGRDDCYNQEFVQYLETESSVVRAKRQLDGNEYNIIPWTTGDQELEIVGLKLANISGEISELKDVVHPDAFKSQFIIVLLILTVTCCFITIAFMLCLFTSCSRPPAPAPIAKDEHLQLRTDIDLVQRVMRMDHHARELLFLKLTSEAQKNTPPPPPY